MIGGIEFSNNREDSFGAECGVRGDGVTRTKLPTLATDLTRSHVLIEDIILPSASARVNMVKAVFSVNALGYISGINQCFFFGFPQKNLY